MGDITEHFSFSEFSCKCPSECNMKDGRKISLELVQNIEVIRGVIESPMVITSGLRCKEWNKLEGGRDNSSHLKGLAIDIQCIDSRHRRKLIDLARHLFFRMGIAKTFIHVDMDTSKAQDITWVY